MAEPACIIVPLVSTVDNTLCTLDVEHRVSFAPRACCSPWILICIRFVKVVGWWAFFATWDDLIASPANKVANSTGVYSLVYWACEHAFIAFKKYYILASRVTSSTRPKSLKTKATGATKLSIVIAKTLVVIKSMASDLSSIVPEHDHALKRKTHEIAAWWAYTRCYIKSGIRGYHQCLRIHNE